MRDVAEVWQEARFVAICVGKSKQIHPGVLSAIGKSPIRAQVRATKLGLDGDQQADLESHGGPDQAIHHYATEHYKSWTDEYPHRQDAFGAGAMGENFSTVGLTELDVCIGDVVTLGTATLEVSQGRKPCVKLTYRLGEPGVLKNFVWSGRTGWYYRVLDEGDVKQEDRFKFVARPNPRWTVRTVVDRILRPRVSADASLHSTQNDLAELCELASLSSTWREWARKRLHAMTQSQTTLT